ncbi:phosphate transport system regulatory protein PhoU [Halobacillus halophilus]|uniref:Phosphate-specific transport system accessory protein PhoU n=1 Tax=Halobacillus halophilus (strain ATCC 35676 / DSM 2266 / JCM 20832 / KCTC 3685 / LMG 17431 / NBRC 102448 / NCIMB 2269) TaxID=866895 RepID=I0JP04_HALH3|nr:phosphate signaling complex protein PhoU [Halobacillus halophilus]ASF39917.1 phosphate transport system regulatory protein PhoU [Halobacillus halophilus]CCG45874.1 phosphate transport system regulatory protein [Halobacillus halophilus DSM 2266]
MVSIRQHFEDELNDLKEKIKELALDSKYSLDTAIHVFYQGDVSKATKIIEDDAIIDAKEDKINEDAILLIAKQQPVARDLRRLITAIKISSDLERMADHGTNIAKATIHLGEDHGIEINPELREMAVLAMDMVDLAVKAFEYEDISLASKLAEMDDVVDRKYGEIVRETLELTAINPQQIQHIMQISYVARYIERFADHITNIGENIFYLVKGQSYDLNK